MNGNSTETEPGARVALAITQERNRELLETLFADRGVVEIDGTVPADTDVCIVDEVSIAEVHGALATWRDDQRPTFAPVLLLAESETTNPWEQYADASPDLIDAIMRIPAPKSAITARLENLLEMRAVSQQLATEHRLTERVFDTSPLAKLVLDADGTVVRLNERATDLFGVSAATLSEESYTAADWTVVDEAGAEIPVDDRPFCRVVETGEPVYGYEYGIERADGEHLWLSVNMAPIRDQSGAVEYVVAAFEDVTVRRAQGHELERQVDLFEKAQDIASVGAWEYDLETEEWYWTKAVSRIYGVPADADPTAEATLEYYHPDDRPVLRDAFTRAVRDGEPYDLELRIDGEDGADRWVRIRGEPQFEAGDVVRIRGTIQDITDRKERELELQQMSRAIDRAPIGVTITDPTQADNPLVYVNEGFLDLTGYTREEVVGRNCRFLQGENTNERTVADIRRALEAEDSVSVVLRNYRADGTEFWNGLEIAPVRDEEGTVTNFIGFQQDVTERMQRRRQLQLLDRYLRHNVRNRMTVVEGMAELIRAKADPSLTEYTDRIISAATSLLENMEKERAITKVLRTDPVVERVELLSLLRSSAETIRARYPEATVSVSGPESVTVRASTRCREAFVELLENAVVHDDDPAPDVSVAVTVDADTATVRVVDDGPGIPEMEVGVLTGTEVETDLYHGQGLGLWLVYLIVSRSGGSISFADRDEGGSVVRVELPLADAT